jgi:hypothetical protein
MDEIYMLFCAAIRRGSEWLWHSVDENVIDGTANGSGRLYRLSAILKRLQRVMSELCDLDVGGNSTAYSILPFANTTLHSKADRGETRIDSSCLRGDNKDML